MNCEKPKVLVVDDDESMRQLLARFFARSGFSVDIAENGFDAFAKLKANRPSVVVTDIVMPVWDGIRLINNMQELKETPPIPYLIISGFTAGAEIMSLTKRSECLGYMAKPLRAGSLVEKIKEYLNKTQRSCTCHP